MTEVSEFTGMLKEGPEDGNYVTASITSFPIVDTVELWLDGKDKDSFIIETHGQYKWNPSETCFEWTRTDIKTYSKKIESS